MPLRPDLSLLSRLLLAALAAFAPTTASAETHDASMDPISITDADPRQSVTNAIYAGDREWLLSVTVHEVDNMSPLQRSWLMIDWGDNRGSVDTNDWLADAIHESPYASNTTGTSPDGVTTWSVRRFISQNTGASTMFFAFRRKFSPANIATPRTLTGSLRLQDNTRADSINNPSATVETRPFAYNVYPGAPRPAFVEFQRLRLAVPEVITQATGGRFRGIAIGQTVEFQTTWDIAPEDVANFGPVSSGFTLSAVGVPQPLDAFRTRMIYTTGQLSYAQRGGIGLSIIPYVKSRVQADDIATVTVQVDQPNAEPVFGVPAFSNPPALGQFVTLAVQFDDADAITAASREYYSTATIAWGDGTTSPAGVQQPTDGSTTYRVSASHVYNSLPTGPAVIEVKDPWLYTYQTSLPVVVANAAPSNLQLTAQPDPARQDAWMLNATWADDGPESSGWSVDIDWGDGRGAQHVVTSTRSLSLSHSYFPALAGTPVIRVTVTDGGGRSVSGSTLQNRAPVVAVRPPLINALVGASVFLDVQLSDPDGDSVSATIDWGDRTGRQPVRSPATHTYLQPGTYQIFVEATDSHGLRSSANATATITNGPVANQPPAPNSIVCAPVPVGAPIFVTFGWTDAEGQAPESARVIWEGQAPLIVGTFPELDVLGVPTGRYRIDLSAPAAGPGVFLGTLALSNQDQLSATDFTAIPSPFSAVILDPGPGNQPPTIAWPAVMPSPVRGEPFTLVGLSAADPDAGDAATLLVDWGDASPTTAGPFTHAYQFLGDRTVTATATDTNGATTTETRTITVRNQLPTIVWPNPLPQPYQDESFTFGVTAQDGDGDACTITVHWNDGPSTTTPPFTHTFANPGQRQIKVEVTDEHGGRTSDGVFIEVRNHLPVVSPVAIAPADIGAAISIPVAFTDADQGDGPYTATIAWQNGTPQTTVIGIASSPTVVQVSGALLPGATAGTYAGTVTVADRWGGQSQPVAFVATIVPVNQAPTIVWPPVLPAPFANETFTLGVTAADADGDAVDLRIEWGDAATSTVAPFEHSYADRIRYTVTATATDGRGGFTRENRAIFVQNRQPTIVWPNPLPQPYQDEAFTLDVTAQDGDGDTCAITVIWLDGPSSTSAPFTHTFADPGQRPIKVEVTDGHGGRTSDGVFIEVRNHLPVVSPVAIAPVVIDAAISIPVAFTDADQGDAPYTATIAWQNGTSLTTVTGIASSPTVVGVSGALLPGAAAGTYAGTVTVADRWGGQSQPVAFVATIVPVNQPPTINAPTTLTLQEDPTTAATVTVTISDDQAEPTVNVVTRTGANATWNRATSELRYTPPADYFGGDTIVITATDAARQQTVHSIAVTVVPVNDAPLGGAAPLLVLGQVYAETGLQVYAYGQGNWSDRDGDVLSLRLVWERQDAPGAWTVVRTAVGTFDFYSLAAADAGKPIRARATASDGTVEVSASSAPIAVAARPGNDDLQTPRAIASGSFAWAGNLNATKEVISGTVEPNHGGNAGGKSVWFTWTPTTSGRFALSTEGSSFDTLLAVYTAQSPTRPDAENDDAGLTGGISRLGFTATAGRQYYIAVDGKNGAGGMVQLNLNSIPGDNFANAVALAGPFPRAQGANVGATMESQEPAHAGQAGGASVWYRWTAPAGSSGRIAIDVRAQSAPLVPVVAVYTGTRLNRLTQVAAGVAASSTTRASASFVPSPGVTYWIAVDGAAGSQGGFNLDMMPTSTN